MGVSGSYAKLADDFDTNLSDLDNLLVPSQSGWSVTSGLFEWIYYATDTENVYTTDGYLRRVDAAEYGAISVLGMPTFDDEEDAPDVTSFPIPRGVSLTLATSFDLETTGAIEFGPMFSFSSNVTYFEMAQYVSEEEIPEGVFVYLSVVMGGIFNLVYEGDTDHPIGDAIAEYGGGTAVVLACGRENSSNVTAIDLDETDLEFFVFVYKPNSNPLLQVENDSVRWRAKHNLGRQIIAFTGTNVSSGGTVVDTGEFLGSLVDTGTTVDWEEYGGDISSIDLRLHNHPSALFSYIPPVGLPWIAMRGPTDPAWPRLNYWQMNFGSLGGWKVGMI